MTNSTCRQCNSTLREWELCGIGLCESCDDSTQLSRVSDLDLQISNLELKIGDCTFLLVCRFNTDANEVHKLIAVRERLTEELRCLKQSVPQQQSE